MVTISDVISVLEKNIPQNQNGNVIPLNPDNFPEVVDRDRWIIFRTPPHAINNSIKTDILKDFKSFGLEIDDSIMFYNSNDKYDIPIYAFSLSDPALANILNSQADIWNKSRDREVLMGLERTQQEFSERHERLSLQEKPYIDSRFNGFIIELDAKPGERRCLEIITENSRFTANLIDTHAAKTKIQDKAKIEVLKTHDWDLLCEFIKVETDVSLKSSYNGEDLIGKVFGNRLCFYEVDRLHPNFKKDPENAGFYTARAEICFGPLPDKDGHLFASARPLDIERHKHLDLRIFRDSFTHYEEVEKYLKNRGVEIRVESIDPNLNNSFGL